MELRYRVHNDSNGYINHEEGDVFSTDTTSVDEEDLKSDNYSGRRYAAAKCANNFWNEHAGDTYGWPLKFELLSGTDEYLGTYEVDVETAPQFRASET